jgi:putative nucleotidyltransferase with HDIG domain
MNSSTIKKVPVNKLEVGMFVNDFNDEWQDPDDHGKDEKFSRNPRKLNTGQEIQSVIKQGIKETFIDITKGKDAEGQTKAEIETELQAQLMALDYDNEEDMVMPDHPPTSFEEELEKAADVKSQARKLVGNILGDARMGKQVSLEAVKDTVREMADSMFRNPDAILSLSIIKSRDEYTFMHSVNVGVFLMSFCRSMDMDEEEIIQIGVGGMLHDIGKMRTPVEILNKQGKLTDDEFKQMQEHVVFSRTILEETDGMELNSIEVASEHHERVDGSGYPNKLKGDQISQAGQMSAIVDVYDAITSDRCYHKGNLPTVALQRMMGWSKSHFNPELLQQFIQCVGIYPISTLVRLENNLLGVVVKSNSQSLLHPIIKIVADAKRKKHLNPMELDLLKYRGKYDNGFRIIRTENPEVWKINPKKFMPNPKLYK